MALMVTSYKGVEVVVVVVVVGGVEHRNATIKQGPG
jgi:hypothetical protein